MYDCYNLDYSCCGLSLIQVSMPQSSPLLCYMFSLSNSSYCSSYIPTTIKGLFRSYFVSNPNSFPMWRCFKTVGCVICVVNIMLSPSFIHLLIHPSVHSLIRPPIHSFFYS